MYMFEHFNYLRHHGYFFNYLLDHVRDFHYSVLDYYDRFFISFDQFHTSLQRLFYFMHFFNGFDLNFSFQLFLGLNLDCFLLDCVSFGLDHDRVIVKFMALCFFEQVRHINEFLSYFLDVFVDVDNVGFDNFHNFVLFEGDGLGNGELEYLGDFFDKRDGLFMDDWHLFDSFNFMNSLYQNLLFNLNLMVLISDQMFGILPNFNFPLNILLLFNYFNGLDDNFLLSLNNYFLNNMRNWKYIGHYFFHYYWNFFLDGNWNFDLNG